MQRKKLRNVRKNHNEIFIHQTTADLELCDLLNQLNVSLMILISTGEFTRDGLLNEIRTPADDNSSSSPSHSVPPASTLTSCRRASAIHISFRIQRGDCPDSFGMQTSSRGYYYFKEGAFVSHLNKSAYGSLN
ncbi:hypothetical protein PAMP_020490 [Pampus punctatissimus]